MGGTFGCVGHPLSPMPEDTFLPTLQQLLPQQLHHVDCFAAPSIKDSSAYTAVDWLKLVQFIQKKQDIYQRFVVIHGTDTLSYASAILARFLGQDTTLIITGSQYPLLEPNGQSIRSHTDAKDNLVFALQQIDQVNCGVYLAFNQKIFHGRSALKAHTTHLDAFEGLTIQKEIEHLPALNITDHHITRAASLNILNLMMQPISLEMLEQNLEYILKNPPHFLILQGFGTGNLVTNPNIVTLLQNCQASNCLPILTTQVTSGGIDQRYAVSAWVKDAHIVTANTLGHADLYAKTLQLYLKYHDATEWYLHWADSV